MKEVSNKHILYSSIYVKMSRIGKSIQSETVVIRARKEEKYKLTSNGFWVFWGESDENIPNLDCGGGCTIL